MDKSKIKLNRQHSNILVCCCCFKEVSFEIQFIPVWVVSQQMTNRNTEQNICNSLTVSSTTGVSPSAKSPVLHSRFTRTPVFICKFWQIHLLDYHFIRQNNSILNNLLFLHPKKNTLYLALMFKLSTMQMLV